MINYLQVENLTKSYGDLVLFDNISFTIGEGQRIALIGRNGSGKTTLLNILAGKDTADSGTITPRRDLRIAYLEQNPEYAMLCYFQHNIAYVEYKVMYSLLFILLVLNYLMIFYTT